MEIRRYCRNSDLISENFEILLEIRHRQNSDFEILAAGFPVYQELIELINHLKYLLINLSIVDRTDQPTEIPLDEPFNS